MAIQWMYDYFVLILNRHVLLNVVHGRFKRRIQHKFDFFKFAIFNHDCVF